MKPTARLLTLAAAMLILAASLAGAQDCVTYADYPHWLGSSGSPGDASCLGLSGSTLYAGCGYVAGVRAVDVSDPANPVDLGGLDLPGDGYTLGLAAAGDFAFVGSYAEGLRVVDMSTPAAPSLAATVSYADCRIYGVAVDGNHAYLADTRGWLRVVDIETPSSASALTSLALSGWPEDVAVAGGYAFVTTGDSLLTVDVSTPAAPFQIGGIGLPGGYIYHVNVVDGRAFVSGGEEGWFIVDVTTPQTPTLLAQVPPFYETNFATALGDLAFAADDEGVVMVYDITDPADPSLINTIGTGASPYRIVADPTGVFVAADYRGLVSLAVSEPAAAFPLTDVTPLPGMGGGMDHRGDTLFVAAGDSLLSFDVVDPSAPARIDALGGSFFMAALPVVHGDHLYLGHGNAGFEIVDISQPDMVHVDNVSPGVGAVAGMSVDGDLMAVTTGMLYLYMYDLTDPASPTLVGTENLGYYALDPVLEDGLLYLIDSNNALRILDVTDPSAPFQVGALSTIRPSEMVKSGSRVYIIDLEDGLMIYDVADPSAPPYLGGLTLPDNYRRGLAICGSLLYVGMDLTGLCVVDVSNPADPLFLGSTSFLGDVRDVHSQGNRVWFTDYDGTLYGAPRDCSDPLPVFLAGFGIRHDTDAVVLDWRVEGAVEASDFRVTASRGVESWNVTVAAVPGGFQAVDRSPRLDVGGAVVYELQYADSEGGWNLLASRTVDLGGTPRATRLVDVRPNPFNPLTEVRFALERAEPVRITVHDLAGGLVAVLADEPFGPGVHAVLWDGRDVDGRPAAAGAYIVRLAATERIDTRKVALVR